MQRIEYLTCFYYSVLFFCIKRCQIDSTHYLIIKIHNKKEFQNIATNLSEDIDYKDLMSICREFTKEPFSFLTIDKTLPASDPLTFRKNLLVSL